MSPSTPRKGQNRNANNNSQSQQHGHGHGHGRNRSYQLQAQGQRQQQLATSDYESDGTPYMASNSKPPAHMSTRTNTDLNMAVLNTYVPSITSVLSIAANAVLYTFEAPSEWHKSNMEGPMFICSQGEHSGEVTENGCLFILNRKSLTNLVLELNTVENFELAGDLLIFKLSAPIQDIRLETGDPVEPTVIGLWTYAEEESDRQTNAALIYEMWSKVREAREKRASLGSEASGLGEA